MWFFRRKSKKPALFDRAMADQHQRHMRIVRELIEIMNKKIIDSIDKNYLSASFFPYEQDRRIMPDMLKVMATYYEEQGFTVHYSVMEESNNQSHRPHSFTVRWPERMWFFRRKFRMPTLFDRAMTDQNERHMRIIRELIEIMNKKIIDSIDKNYLSASFLPYEQDRRIMPDMLKVMSTYYEEQGFIVHYSVMEESNTQSHRPHIFTVRWPEPKAKNIAKENLHGSKSI